MDAARQLAQLGEPFGELVADEAAAARVGALLGDDADLDGPGIRGRRGLGAAGGGVARVHAPHAALVRPLGDEEVGGSVARRGVHEPGAVEVVCLHGLLQPGREPVGDETADRLREKLIPAIQALRVGISTDSEAHYGPVVSQAHRERIEHYIEMGEREGAELVVDGRGFTLQGHEKGFFIGPTFFDRVTPGMQSYKDEIFGPVLQMVRAKDFDEAVRLPSEHEYGNGVAIFTRNGHAAREFTSRVNVGMVGVNVPIPVPVSYHSFGGWKRSGFGDIGQYGQEGMRFWTKSKVVTQRWPDGSPTGENAFVIPTMG